PESRSTRPKQLLNLIGERTMIQSTVDRLASLVPPERLLIVTGASLAAEIRAQLPDLRARAVLAEPCRRDTAPRIGGAALAVLRSDAGGFMAVMPSEHVTSRAATFRGSIQLAERLVRESPERIVTFGIRPSYPAESFGYIDRGERLSDSSGEWSAYRV